MKTGWRPIGITALCVFCFAALNGLGADLQLAWEPSESSDVIAYKLYHTSSTATNVWPTGWELVATKTNVAPQAGLTIALTNVSLGTHRWVLTAVTAYGVESDPSNEVALKLEKPSPPWQLRAGPQGTTTVLSRSFDLRTWEPVYTFSESTNAAVFFRIELRNVQ